MKILQVSTQIFPVPPSGYGGLEGVVEDLSVELLKMGHEVTIVCPKGSNVPFAKLIMATDPDFSNPENVAYEAYKDRLSEFDIIHNHSWAAYPYLAKKDNPELNVMSTIHSQQPWGSAPPVTYPCLVGASKIHSEIISAWSGKHCEVVYHGINLDTYKYSDEERKYLLYVARVVPFKGAHEFVALCKRLDIPGILVGEDVYIDAKDHQYVRQVMDTCDGKHVKYMGRVPRGSDLMVDLMQGAMALISPLLSPYVEIFGLSTIEAMACGAPVISTNHGAARELIVQGKTGYVVDNISDLDEAVKKLDKIDPKDCRAQAELFNRSKMATDYEKLYRKILDKKVW